MAQKQEIIHSDPAWVSGRRKVHSKFGGKEVAGIHSVRKRLTTLKKNFSNDYSSGHVFLEIGVEGSYTGLNKPGSINYSDLYAGIKKGIFPRWSAMTAPAFGLNGCENGSILNENDMVRTRARWAHLTAIRWSRKLKRDGLGKGICIWWPAFDSEQNHGPLANINRKKVRKKLVDWWVETMKIALDYPEISADLEDNEVIMWLEFKPSVPGKLDLFPTMKSAIWFCNEVNRLVGRRVFAILFEFAHGLIGGSTVSEAVKMQIDAGLFCKIFHGNSAELAIVNWNETGTEIVSGSPGDDKDWAMGEGGLERWNDQEKALELMIETGQDIIIEHDIDPTGENPIECYARSRRNANKMIANIKRKRKMRKA